MAKKYKEKNFTSNPMFIKTVDDDIIKASPLGGNEWLILKDNEEVAREKGRHKAVLRMKQVACWEN